jgi:hypothetical protein
MGGSGWVENMREPGVFWDEEPLSKLKVKGLGKATNKKLEKNGISMASKLKNLTSAEIGAIAVIKENKIMTKILTDLRDAFVASQPCQVTDCTI